MQRSALFRSQAPCDASGRLHPEAGVTLLEMLVVIAIIGLLVGLIAPQALRQLGNARVSVAKQSVERLASVLDLYQLATGSYPSTEQGLKALIEKPAGVDSWNGPYLKGNSVPEDPWKHAYVYRAPSKRTGYDFDLCSPGPNDTPGDVGADGTICNK